MEPYSLHADIPHVITALLHAYAVPIINAHLQVNKEKRTVSSQRGTLWSHGIFPGRGFTAEIGALVKDLNAFHNRLPHEHVSMRHGYTVVPHLSFTVS